MPPLDTRVSTQIVDLRSARRSRMTGAGPRASIDGRVMVDSRSAPREPHDQREPNVRESADADLRRDVDPPAGRPMGDPEPELRRETSAPIPRPFPVDQRVGAEPLESLSWPAEWFACDGRPSTNLRTRSFVRLRPLRFFAEPVAELTCRGAPYKYPSRDLRNRETAARRRSTATTREP